MTTTTAILDRIRAAQERVVADANRRYYEGFLTERDRPLLCASGRHLWRDPESRRRCCNGYIRVQDTNRAGLVAIGAEHIVLAGMWRGWQRVETTEGGA